MIIFDVKNGGISARLLELPKPENKDIKRLYVDPPYRCPEPEKEDKQCQD